MNPDWQRRRTPLDYTTFDRYEVLEEIGRGGMGRVVLARQGGPGDFSRLVVVKLLHKELVEDELVRRLFYKEAQITAQLNHSNIVRIYDVGEHEGAPFLVMEHVHGRTLDQVQSMATNDGALFPLDEALHIAIQLCRGLHHVHDYVDEFGRAHDLIHRDVKPKNVLLTFSGEVKLIDFGVAKARHIGQQTTTSGSLRGTIPFMSPEQVSGDPLTPRSDLFSLGVLLYVLLTGENPFQRGQMFHCFEAILREEVAPPSQMRPDVEPGLDAIVGRCLAKRPEHRPASAQEVEHTIERMVLGLGAPLLSELMNRLFPDDVRLRLPSSEAGPPAAEDATPAHGGPTPGSSGPNNGGSSETTATAPTVPAAARTPVTGPGSAASEDSPRVPTVTTPQGHLEVVDDLSRIKGGGTTGPSGVRHRLLMTGAIAAVAVVAGFIGWLALGPGSERPSGPLVHRPVAADARTGAPVPEPDARVQRGEGPLAPTDLALEKARDAQAERRAVRPPRSPPSPSAARPPSPSAARPPSPSAARLPRRRFGRVTIRVQPATTVRLGGRRAHGRFSGALKAARGRFRIGGATSALKASLRYTVREGALDLTVSSRPASIVYPSGATPKRAPHRVTIRPNRLMRLDLRGLRGGELSIVVSYGVR